MVFVLGYLLFFAVDILAANGFLILGMMPMSYLTAGVGLFATIIILKRLSICVRLITKRLLFYSFILILVVTVLVKLIVNIRTMLGLDRWIDFGFFISHVIAIFTIVLLILLLTIGRQSNSLWRWMVYSLATSLSHYALWEILSPVPPIIYRYYGIMDLFILFGWLMIVRTLLKEELAQNGYTANPSLC